jgi:hypothetical protein
LFDESVEALDTVPPEFSGVPDAVAAVAGIKDEVVEENVDEVFVSSDEEPELLRSVEVGTGVV